MRVVVLLFGEQVSPRMRLLMDVTKCNCEEFYCVRWFRQDTEKHEALDIILPAPEWSAKLLFKLPEYWLKLYRVCKSMQGKDTIFVASHFFHLPVLIWLQGEKVYDAAEMYPLDLAEYFGVFKKLVRPFIALMEGLMVSRLNGVLTVDSRGGWLEQHFQYWNKHVEVIWNVPSLNDKPDSGLVNKLTDNYSGRHVVAYVGGLMREKGLRVALEAAAMVKETKPDVLFLFIGPMKDDDEAVAMLVQSLGIKNVVRFFEAMPYREMMAHLKHAEIGLALYQNERTYSHASAGNGRKFFTYMQASLAIIGPDFGEIGKAVQLANCGVLVDTHDAHHVADAICEMLGNNSNLKQLQTNSREAFEKRFNWELEKQKVEQFFKELQ